MPSNSFKQHMAKNRLTPKRKRRDLNELSKKQVSDTSHLPRVKGKPRRVKVNGKGGKTKVKGKLGPPRRVKKKY